MKSVELCGRLFCCFPPSFGPFATTQGGRAPQRGQVSPSTDGTALVGNHVWHHFPSLPLQHRWLTLRESRCARSMALPNAPFPPGDKDTACLQALSGAYHCPDTADRPHGRGHPREAGKCEDTCRMASKVTFNHSHCPYQTDFIFLFFLLLVLWKGSEVKHTSLEHERHFRKHWRTTSACGFDKRENRLETKVWIRPP